MGNSLGVILPSAVARYENIEAGDDIVVQFLFVEKKGR